MVKLNHVVILLLPLLPTIANTTTNNTTKLTFIFKCIKIMQLRLLLALLRIIMNAASPLYTDTTYITTSPTQTTQAILIAPFHGLVQEGL